MEGGIFCFRIYYPLGAFGVSESRFLFIRGSYFEANCQDKLEDATIIHPKTSVNTSHPSQLTETNSNKFPHIIAIHYLKTLCCRHSQLHREFR